uniref:Putative P22-like portal protein n=1 Tax=viral metagenome TaxID=1070528 RepID=A0A6M3IL95_9ZZZZ
MMNKEEKDLIALALNQSQAAIDHDDHNREKALEDLKFIFAEDQWEDDVKAARSGRPCLNANDLPIFLDQVVGIQRQNRIGIKATPFNINTNQMDSDVISGLIRKIEQLSDAHVAYDNALESAAASGYGAIRILTQYENEDLFNKDGTLRMNFQEEDAVSAFDQEIRIAEIENPLNVLRDPNSKLWHGNDGKFMFYFDDINVDAFKEKYPGKQLIDFDGGYDLDGDLENWGNVTEKTVRVAEWFLKENIGTKIVYLILNDDEKYELTTEKPEDPKRILKEREVEDFKIVWRKISGKEVLEGPIDIPGRLFPIVPVWGKKININGKQYVRGMFRYVKDPQRMYIYTQSAITETVALTPKVPFMATPKMVGEFIKDWEQMNVTNKPVLLFEPDPNMPGVFPKRQDPPNIPMGLVEQAATRQAEKRDIIGLHEASLGKRSNETSGLAIRERKQQGDIVAYPYYDNVALAVKQVGRVIAGMIPEIYDTPRALRILGMDGKETTVKVNQEAEHDVNQISGIDRTTTNVVKTNIDLRKGRHEIAIQAGPGYATQRQEALDRLTQVMQYAPAVAASLVDIVVDLMDIPQGERIVQRLEKISGGSGQITEQKVAELIQKAIEDFRNSAEGNKLLLQVEQQRLKLEQERMQLEQEKVKLLNSKDNLKEIIAGMMANGEL